MTDSSTVLDELELDALTEIVNIGIGKAAVSLRDMVGHEVRLSIPAVRLISRADAVETIGIADGRDFVAIHQGFEGDISGRALLIFPESRSLELVRAVIGGELSLDDIIELEQEALAETGNIILNSCLSTIANLLRRNLRISLPAVKRGRHVDLFEIGESEASDAPLIVFFYINFSVEQKKITGYIAMLMDMPSITALKALLRMAIDENLV